MPYGETWIDEAYNTELNGFKFTSKELDPETLMYYYGARHMDPMFSRWMSVDPGEDGLNWYEFCGSNPVNYIDPDGRMLIVDPFGINEHIADNVGGFFAGCSDALVENIGGISAGSVNGHPNSTAYYLGRYVGDLASVVGGATGGLAGGTAVVVEVSSGAGALAVAPTAGFTVASSVVAANGLANAYKDGRMLAQSGSGGNGKLISDKPTKWTATRPKGTKQTYDVYQRNDIDWNRKRTAGSARFIGKTNAEAAQYGYAPQLSDGSFSTLHHLGQNSKGPLVEASTRYHGVSKYGQHPLHSTYGTNKPHPQNPIDRDKFGIDTREYWKWREQNR